MTICTVRSGGTVDAAAAVVTLDDDPVPDPQPANSDPSATAADSHAAMFRMMRRDAACNWPRVPNDSVPTLTETPTLSGAVQSPACRATVPAGRAAARKDVENQGAGRRDTDDTLERAADRRSGRPGSTRPARRRCRRPSLARTTEASNRSTASRTSLRVPSRRPDVGYACFHRDRPGFCAAAGRPETALARHRIREVSASADVAQFVEHFTRNEGLPGSRWLISTSTFTTR